jgi:CheY-like chemotaxis protein
LEVPVGYKIMLADDSVTVQKIITLTFSDEGVDVLTVNTGDEAISHLEDVRPALVMADISVPGKNGYEICEYVKNHPEMKDTPVVLLVPAFEPFDEERARRSGANHYLTKPFQSIRALISTVKDLIEPGRRPAVPPVSPVAEVNGDDRSEALRADDHWEIETGPAFHFEEDLLLEREVSQVELGNSGPLSSTSVIERSISLPGSEGGDDVLELDDVFADLWRAPSEVTPAPGDEGSIVAADTIEEAQGEGIGITPQHVQVTLSQELVDEIVSRVVAQVTAELTDRLSQEVARRVTSEVAEIIKGEQAGRKFAYQETDSLLELDEI